MENVLRVTIRSSRFPSLFVRLVMNADILPRLAASYPKRIPFDFACPNMQDKLMQRVCKQCGLYHASVTCVKAYESANKECRHKALHKTCLLLPGLGSDHCGSQSNANRNSCARYMGDVDLEWLDKEDGDIHSTPPTSVTVLVYGTHVIPLNPWKGV